MKCKNYVLLFLLIVLTCSLNAVSFNNLEFNGFLATDLSYSNGDQTEEETNLDLSDLELYVTASPLEKLQAYIAVYYEEDYASFEIDEAYATIQLLEDYDLSITAGKMYLPSVEDNSNFSNYSYSYNLATLWNTAVKADFNLYDFNIFCATYKTELEGNKNTDINAFVAGFHKDVTIENIEGTLSAKYMNSLLDEEIGAVSLSADLSMSDFNLTGEYVRTIEKMEDESQPEAYHIELAYYFNENLSFAAKFDQTKELEENEDFGESLIGGFVAYKIFESEEAVSSLKLNYYNEKDYQEEVTEEVVLRLEVEF